MKQHINISKQQFERYLTVQKMGGYNMIDPRARQLTQLSRREYIYIMENYHELIKKFKI